MTCADGYGAEDVDALGDALGLEELELFPETTVRGRGRGASLALHLPVATGMSAADERLD